MADTADKVRAFLSTGIRTAKLATVTADGVPGERLVRIAPTKIIAARDVAS